MTPVNLLTSSSRHALSDMLVIATHNQGKLREFEGLLAGLVPSLTSAGSLGLPEPEETGISFAENALIKANAASVATGKVALSDDSGLCVTALHDAPGIFSARWAGPDKDFRHAMERIHRELGNNTDRSAYFICVLALAWPDSTCRLFEGRIDGQIMWPPQGEHGHGYDPVFVPNGSTSRFAEMDEATKNAISHRGIAVRKLIDYLKAA